MLLKYEVDANNVGRRLDVYVRQVCCDVPLGTLMKWLRLGTIRLNNRRVKPATRLCLHDVVQVPQTALSVTPRVMVKNVPRLDESMIVYQDADLLVINKPAGMACHAGTGHLHDSLMSRVSAYLQTEHAAVGAKPGLVQRLDQAVSGLLVIGRHASALRVLSQAVIDQQLTKKYITLVHGHVPNEQGDIRLALRVDDEPMGNRPRVHPDPQGKPAHTRYRVLQRLSSATLLEITLFTGRTHQIRAHMRAINHPILGDPRYGIASVNMALWQTFGLQRPFLHAGTLEFFHPTHGTWLQFEAPLPIDLQRVQQAKQHAKKYIL